MLLGKFANSIPHDLESSPTWKARQVVLGSSSSPSRVVERGVGKCRPEQAAVAVQCASGRGRKTRDGNLYADLWSVGI
eukprot:scaffold70873_cov69-Phaeocystis_antarctica.AAC.3